MEINKQVNSGEKINTCTVGVDSCKCFDYLTEDERELLNKNTVNVKFKAGEVICKQGTFASNLVYVCSGLLKVFMEGENENLVLKIIPDSNMAGLTSLFNNENVFLYSIQAYVDSEVRLINIDTIRELIKVNTEFATAIIRLINANTVQTYARFFSLTQRQSFGRLADILMCLSDRIFKDRKFNLPLKRKELGELCDMTPESVIRILKHLKDQKYISIEGKDFTILDYNKLKELRDKG